jgi:aminodeoxyfutalosine deaminase
VIVRARIVLPLSRPPIPNGAVAISGNRIAAVGLWKDIQRKFSGHIVDLAEAVFLPGLVNGHCHLDYTGMAGQIAPPKVFPDWIKSLLGLKAEWSYSDYAQSWISGAKMLLRRGVTTVADIEAVPELLPEVWTATPLRVFSFLEMTGVRSGRSPKDILHEAVHRMEALPQRNWVGLSPHAPYSTTPELLRLTGELSRKRHCRITTHLSESAAEADMFISGRGPLFDWLKRERDVTDCGLGSPIHVLERAGLLNENLLAVHVNYLCAGDAELLGRRGVSVVHCPRSHAYFQHQPFPFIALQKAGVNICLGTDSLVSVKKKRGQPLELDMFTEMRAFASGHPRMNSETILKMSTLHPARALGLQGKIGQLSHGSFADAIAIPFAGDPEDVCEAVVANSSEPFASMINGQWLSGPGLGSEGLA